MKKLILSLVLLITATSVGFGKPAYKQWKDYQKLDSGGVSHGNGGILMLEYGLYGTGRDKDGNVMLAVYLNTNQIANGKVDVYCMASVTEAIDFSVGSNTVTFSTYVGRLESKGQTDDGRYIYQVTFKDVDVELLNGGKVSFWAVYKIPVGMSVFTFDFYKRWRDDVIAREVKEREEAEAKAEVESLAKTKRLLNDKKYDVEYEAGVDALVVRVQDNNVNMQGETLKVGLQLNRTNYQPKFIQFRLYSADGNTFGLMQRAVIYTADGSMTLRCIMQNYFSPTYNEYRTIGYKTFTLSWCNSGDFYHLNDLLKSGKAVKISFSGSASVIHTLTASERKALSDLLDVVFTRWNVDRKTASGNWED